MGDQGICSGAAWAYSGKVLRPDHSEFLAGHPKHPLEQQLPIKVHHGLIGLVPRANTKLPLARSLGRMLRDGITNRWFQEQFMEINYTSGMGLQ